MPMHEYHCLDCHDEFEMLVRPAASPLSCPSCASQRLDRVLSSFAVSSAARSTRALARARETYRTNTTRQAQARHRGEMVREHLQEDYGVDLERHSSVREPSPARSPSKDKP